MYHKERQIHLPGVDITVQRTHFDDGPRFWAIFEYGPKISNQADGKPWRRFGTIFHIYLRPVSVYLFDRSHTKRRQPYQDVTAEMDASIW